MIVKIKILSLTMKIKSREYLKTNNNNKENQSRDKLIHISNFSSSSFKIIAILDGWLARNLPKYVINLNKFI